MRTTVLLLPIPVSSEELDTQPSTLAETKETYGNISARTGARTHLIMYQYRVHRPNHWSTPRLLAIPVSTGSSAVLIRLGEESCVKLSLL